MYNALKKSIVFGLSLLGFFIVIFYSSCATILNKKSTTITIHTIPDQAQIILNKKDSFCCNKDLFVVKRSGYPLEIKAKKDSLEKTVYVTPLLSSTYVLPNLINGWMWGGGYLIDLASRKRFTYPKDIYINMNKKDDRYTTQNETQLINLVLHLPILNDYNFSIPNQIIPNLPNMWSSGTHTDTIGGSQSLVGFLGLSGSIEYYLNKNYYLSGNIGYYPKFPLFLYSSPTRDYRYMSLSINRRIKRFHIGAGLAWSKFYYSNDVDAENSDPYGYCSTSGYALRLEAQYQLTDNWYLATNIQPLIAKEKSGNDNNFNFWGLELNYKISLATKNSDSETKY